MIDVAQRKYGQWCTCQGLKCEILLLGNEQLPVYFFLPNSFFVYSKVRNRLLADLLQHLQLVYHFMLRFVALNEVIQDQGAILLLKGHFKHAIIHFVHINCEQSCLFNHLKLVAYVQLLNFSLVMLSFHLSKLLHLFLSQEHHYPLHLLLFFFLMNFLYLLSNLHPHTFHDGPFDIILSFSKGITIFIIKLDVKIILHAPCCKSHVFQHKAQGMFLGPSQQIFPNVNLQFSISLGQHEYFIISGHFQDSLAPIRNAGRINPEAAIKLLLLIWVNGFVSKVSHDLVLDLMKEIRLLVSAQMLKMLTKNDVLL